MDSKKIADKAIKILRGNGHTVNHKDRWYLISLVDDEEMHAGYESEDEIVQFLVDLIELERA